MSEQMINNNAPRSRLMALLLAALWPGLGQLYNGEINKAAWFILLTLLGGLPLGAVLLLRLPASWTVYILGGMAALVLILWLSGMIDAVVSAHRKQQYQPQLWQGLGVYLLVFIFISQFIYPLLSSKVRQYWIEGFMISSVSMEPTLIAGDWIFVDRRYNCIACRYGVQRGDVVIFTYPNDRTVSYIKRVIALPGDKVSLRGMQVSVNGKPISSAPVFQEKLAVVQESYENKHWLVVWRHPEKASAPFDIEVKPGEVFVMGDNRSNSNDSRVIGTIPLCDISGRAKQIWLSYSRPKGGLQWDRIGRAIQ